MLSKNDIKFIRSLSTNKYRRETHCFVAEGSKIINELLNSRHSYRKIFTLDSSKVSAKDNVFEISEKELKQISNLQHPQDSLGIFEFGETEFKDVGPKGDLLLACDRIQDPGNMGTIVRIADWFGIDQILCSKDCADIYNPKVVQSTMGSLSRVKIFYVDLTTVIPDLITDFKVFSTSLDGKNLYEIEIPQKSILVLGNESKGVSSDVMKMSSDRIKIPAHGKAESLNVAVATGIICAEFRRPS